ncbi:ran-interacting Mog1 protein [Trichodelitschia bisporula]|uniref:Ran-interacting Mog1 protein n=1 Tax=Trichodelitschia bisporula TaxID=703511 RepID=A0A6G1I5E9_9PEZI|nr:ran-interacting Mog1 protein [Trichodelitschia bisporula]
MTAFNTVPLFGGALTADLPRDFADVSTIRQVPDNQEVYLHTTGLTSIIFDITERVIQPNDSSDEAALRFHFADIVTSSADETRIWADFAPAALAKMPSTPAFTMFATQHPSAAPSRSPQADFTAILLVLVRLAAQKTDIVISINVPHVADEYSRADVDLEARKPGPLLGAAIQMRDRILETFEVKDWDLFVNEEEEA